MTKEKYLDMCAALGDDIDPEKMPPDIEDFPPYVIIGLNIFNVLPDTYSGGMEPIYSGKDYSCLQVFFQLFQVPEEEQMMVFEIIKLSDDRARKRAIERAKRKTK